MENAGKRCLAELIGTFGFVFVGAGAICMGAYDDTLSTLAVALAHGLAMSAMISALGAVSGGHFNPAVTFGFLVTGRISALMGALYALAQLAGGVLAAYLLRMIFADAGQDVSFGTPMLNADAGVTQGTAILVEAVLTFFLVVVVFGTAVDPRHPRVGGFGIGLVISADVLMGGSITGAAMNPARAFGPALASGMWDAHLVYWVGPLLGGAIGALVYHHLLMEKGS